MRNLAFLCAQMLHFLFPCWVRDELVTPEPILLAWESLWIQGPGDPSGELMGHSRGTHLGKPGSENSLTRLRRGIFSFFPSS